MDTNGYYSPRPAQSCIRFPTVEQGPHCIDPPWLVHGPWGFRGVDDNVEFPRLGNPLSGLRPRYLSFNGGAQQPQNFQDMPQPDLPPPPMPTPLTYTTCHQPHTHWQNPREPHSNTPFPRNDQQLAHGPHFSNYRSLSGRNFQHQHHNVYSPPGIRHAVSDQPQLHERQMHVGWESFSYSGRRPASPNIPPATMPPQHHYYAPTVHSPSFEHTTPSPNRPNYDPNAVTPYTTRSIDVSTTYHYDTNETTCQPLDRNRDNQHTTREDPWTVFEPNTTSARTSRLPSLSSTVMALPSNSNTSSESVSITDSQADRKTSDGGLDPQQDGSDQREDPENESIPRGKKRALLIGINYSGRYKLQGCIHDVLRTYMYLTENGGYQGEDIVILADDSDSGQHLPTRANIIREIESLVKGAQDGDIFFFHYSGHGGQVKDMNGDEITGQDQCIYPVDHEKNGVIIDDDLHDILVRPLPKGCLLTAVFDACHSGSILDLPYAWHINKDNTGHGSLKKTTNGTINECSSTKAHVISWSACKDREEEVDGNQDGLDVGAMNAIFLSSIMQKPNQSYVELFSTLRKGLHKYNQHPQLSSSHEFDATQPLAF